MEVMELKCVLKARVLRYNAVLLPSHINGLLSVLIQVMLFRKAVFLLVIAVIVASCLTHESCIKFTSVKVPYL